MAEQMMHEAAVKAIPAGYKQTEVGIIPEDWGVKKGRELFTKIQDGTHFSPKISNGGFLYITSKNIKHGYLDLTSVEYIDKIQHEKIYKRCDVLKNDILLTKDGVNTGNVALNTLAQPFSLLSSVAFLRLDVREHNPVFFVQQILSGIFQSVIKDEMSGNAITRLTLGKINNLKFYVPMVQEQTAIANVLSDSDALIDALEQLIAKKQAIKSATMQQLLTGRTRLPAFALRPDGSPKGYKHSELGEIPEDWEVAPFGNLFEKSISRKNLRATEIVSFVGMQDVTETAQLHNQTSITYEKLKAGFTYFECGDVLVAKITPCFENGKGCHTKSLRSDVGFGSTEFHVLRAVANADSDFIYYWTTQVFFRKQLELEMVGSAGHRRVPLPAIQSYMIPCSMNKQEQTAIATILSDMDNELQALTQKLDKARALKQGMMQQLLTGKIRLPLEAGA